MYVEHNIWRCSLHLQRETLEYIQSHASLILQAHCALVEQAFNECNCAQNHESKYSEALGI